MAGAEKMNRPTNAKPRTERGYARQTFAFWPCGEPGAVCGVLPPYARSPSTGQARRDWPGRWKDHSLACFILRPEDAAPDSEGDGSTSVAGFGDPGLGISSPPMLRSRLASAMRFLIVSNDGAERRCPASPSVSALVPYPNSLYHHRSSSG